MKPDEVLYWGQVVHGLTGEAMPGAFVVATAGFMGGSADISAEEWEIMHNLADSPLNDDPALKPLRKICPFQNVVRADHEGWFELTVKSLDKHFNLVTLDQDYMPVVIGTKHVKLDKDRVGLVHPMRLYPAAKFAVRPCLEDKGTEVLCAWRIEQTSEPDWLDEFRRYCDKPEIDLVQGRKLVRNKSQVTCVPAGAPVQMELSVRHREGFWFPIVFETFTAKQGEIINAGDYAFEKEMPVYLELTDSAGYSVAGVAVSLLDFRGRDLFQTHTTDANGVAGFMVPPHYQGRFSIQYSDENKTRRQYSVPYQTTGRQDANSTYTMTVSGEMLNHLFK
jgi:hypothetical protein